MPSLCSCPLTTQDQDVTPSSQGDLRGLHTKQSVLDGLTSPPPPRHHVISNRSVTFDEEWRPLSPLRTFPMLPLNARGVAPLEREPFLFKHPITSGQSGPFIDHTPFQKESDAMHATMMHSTVLPPRPVAPTMPSFSSDSREIGTAVSSPVKGSGDNPL